MKNQSHAVNLEVWLSSLLTIAIALTVGIVVLNLLWANYSPPFPMPKVLPAITAPVDGPFYLLNAEHGYDWNPNDRLSLWFHPLMSYLVRFMPSWFPSNIWFWLISVTFAIGSILLTAQLTSIVGTLKGVPYMLLPLILLAPGGLEIATGNAEIPTLFFALGLLLSVLQWQKWWLTILFAGLAILTKPNALYMVPVLLVYFISGLFERNNKLWVQALIGILALLIVWVMWIWYVDWKTRVPGTYWSLRELSSLYEAQDAPGFLDHLARSFLDGNDIQDQLRYSVALIIPIANLWMVGFIPMLRERDRNAIVAGNLAMLAIALFMGNPNKIIVYTTTLPGNFVMHILFIEKLLTRGSFSNSFLRFGIAALYATYCIAMLIFYMLGTPLGWYY